jgi:hypothetical protein
VELRPNAPPMRRAAQVPTPLRHRARRPRFGLPGDRPARGSRCDARQYLGASAWRSGCRNRRARCLRSAGRVAQTQRVHRRTLELICSPTALGSGNANSGAQAAGAPIPKAEPLRGAQRALPIANAGSPCRSMAQQAEPRSACPPPERSERLGSMSHHLRSGAKLPGSPTPIGSPSEGNSTRGALAADGDALEGISSARPPRQTAKPRGHTRRDERLLTGRASPADAKSEAGPGHSHPGYPIRPPRP